jgi:hypothetical protein
MQRRAGDRHGGTTLPAGRSASWRRPGPYRAHRAARSDDLARETTAAFSVDGTRTSAGRVSEQAPEAVIGGLRSAVDVIADLDHDACDDQQLDSIIRGVQRQLDRLTSTRDRMVAARHHRRLLAAGPGREAATARDSDRQLVDELGFTAGEAKRTRNAGRQLLDRPELAAAVDEGRLRPDQARVIGTALREAPPETHEALSGDLLEAAATQNATSLGATARRRLAELDQDAAVDAERRRHARRTGKMSRGPDGMLDVHGRFSGLDAETVATAIHAFRTPDAPGSSARTPEQRTADAIVAVCRAALDGGTAPADRRVKPHVIVTIGLDDLARRRGAGVGRWTGPIPVTELERFATTATIRVLGLDVHGLPIALSRASDHVTASQYLAFAHRDGGCRYPGCDTPAAWCDVAHAVARRDRGPISLGNALLLCRRHHRRIDEGGWTITVDGVDASFTHPNGRVLQAARARGQPAGGASRLAGDRPGGTDPPG